MDTNKDQGQPGAVATTAAPSCPICRHLLINWIINTLASLVILAGILVCGCCAIAKREPQPGDEERE